MGINVKNLQDKVKKAVQQSADMNEAKAGGTYEPPAEGMAMLRFIGWIETGQHKTTYKGVDKLTYKGEAIFELHGKKYPVEEVDGKKFAKRLTVKLNLPDPGKNPGAKSTLYKLFKAMNWENKYTHIAEMLGQDFIGTVFHREYEQDGEKRVAAQFNDPKIEESPLTIRSPHLAVMGDDGEPETKRVKVPDPVSELRLFLWSNPDAEQWASIYIPGEYENGNVKRSKNVWQNRIKAAVNFEGSEIEALLLGDPDVGDAEDPKETAQEARKQAAKPPKGAGVGKGTGSGKKASSGAKKGTTDDVTEKASANPLAELENVDDDIPF